MGVVIHHFLAVGVGFLASSNLPIKGYQHAHTTSVFVNELDTTGFQATAHHFERCATRLMRAGLELAHGHDAHPCSFREFLLAPVKKAASGATLR